MSSSRNSTNVRPSTAMMATWMAMRASEILAPGLASDLALRLFTTPRRFDRPDREIPLLEAATPLAVAFEGDELAAWAWGDGPTVVLVHGWEGRGAQLGAFVVPLVRAGFRVVAFDGPAHGDSPGHRTNLLHLARALQAVGEQHGPVFGVVAHSMGAAAATVALSRGLRAERLVFVAPPGPLDDVLRGFAAFVGIQHGTALGMQRRLQKQLHTDLHSVDLHELAPERTEPLLVIHDRDDKDTRFEGGVRLADTWPGATMYPTEGLGHRKVLRDPEVLAAATAFVVGHADLEATNDVHTV